MPRARRPDGYPDPREPSSRRRIKPRVPAVLTDASLEPDIVEIPARSAIALEGRGAPESETFINAVDALSAVASTALRLVDVLPLEARFFAEPPYASLSEAPREEWSWKLRIAVPDDVDEDAVRADNVALEHIPPMRVGRVLHVGPYGKDMMPSFEKVHAMLTANGLAPSGAHCEVYLNDPRETRPEELETIILVEIS
jgi:hypothetical protein